MTADLLMPPRFCFFDQLGNPLAGGFVNVLDPATMTPKASWQDAAQTIPNTAPIVLDANGSCLLYGDGTYFLQTTDSLGNAVPEYSGYTQAGVPEIWTDPATGNRYLVNGSITTSVGFISANHATPLLTSDNSGNTKITGTLETAAGLTVDAGGLTVSAGGAAITGNSKVTGALETTSALTVDAGGASITGGATITGTLGITAGLNVGGITTFSGNPYFAAFALSGEPTYQWATGVYAVWDGTNLIVQPGPFGMKMLGLLEADGNVSGPFGGGWVYNLSGPAGPAAPSTIGVSIGAVSNIIASSFFAQSDEWLKEEIAEITAEQAERYVSLARPILYRKNGAWEAGLSAQDQIRAGYGQFVSTYEKKGIPRRDYGEFSIEEDRALQLDRTNPVAYLLACCKALMARVEALEAAAVKP